jgi:hypothetical protein
MGNPDNDNVINKYATQCYYYITKLLFRARFALRQQAEIRRKRPISQSSARFLIRGRFKFLVMYKLAKKWNSLKLKGFLVPSPAFRCYGLEGVALACPAQRNTYRKAPLGLHYRLIKQLTLLPIPLVLSPDVFPHGTFISRHRAHPLSGRPKMQTRHPTFLHQFPMYSYCALPFQKSYRACHTVLWRDAQTQMLMIIHRASFRQPDPLLIAQFPQDPRNRNPKTPPKWPSSDISE